MFGVKKLTGVVNQLLLKVQVLEAGLNAVNVRTQDVVPKPKEEPLLFLVTFPDGSCREYREGDYEIRGNSLFILNKRYYPDRVYAQGAWSEVKDFRFK